MPSSPPLTAILHHTPPWVWALLTVLLTLGFMQTLPRRVSVLRAALLPVAMLVWSLWGVAAGFGGATALAAWAAGVLASASAAERLGAPAGARWSAAERCFELPGSWVPLALIVALFCIKFGVGTSLALHPALGDNAAFAHGASLAYGAFSGVFAGRALALLRLARAADFRPAAAQDNACS